MPLHYLPIINNDLLPAVQTHHPSAWMLSDNYTGR